MKADQLTATIEQVTDIVNNYPGLKAARKGNILEIRNQFQRWRTSFEKECQKNGIDLHYTTEAGGKDYFVELYTGHGVMQLIGSAGGDKNFEQ